jgi:hypothetical protein
VLHEISRPLVLRTVVWVAVYGVAEEENCGYPLLGPTSEIETATGELEKDVTPARLGIFSESGIVTEVTVAEVLAVAP